LDRTAIFNFNFFLLEVLTSNEFKLNKTEPGKKSNPNAETSKNQVHKDSMPEEVTDVKRVLILDLQHDSKQQMDCPNPLKGNNRLLEDNVTPSLTPSLTPVLTPVNTSNSVPPYRTPHARSPITKRSPDRDSPLLSRTDKGRIDSEFNQFKEEFKVKLISGLPIIVVDRALYLEKDPTSKFVYCILLLLEFLQDHNISTFQLCLYPSSSLFVKELQRTDPMLKFPSDSYTIGTRLKIDQWWNELILPEFNSRDGAAHVKFLKTTVEFYEILCNADHITRKKCQLDPTAKFPKSYENVGTCKSGPKCEHKNDQNYPCKYSHSTHVECSHEGTKKNGLIYQCSTQATDRLVLDFKVKDPLFSKQLFVMQSRVSEPTRDILVLWNDHKTCSDIVKLEEFWDIMIKLTQDECFGPNYLEALLVNFGEWEKGVSRDPNLATCHGHAHVIITEKTFDTLVAKKRFETPLEGRRSPPNNHLNQDLGEARVLYASHSCFVLSQKVDDLDKKVDDLDKKVVALTTNVNDLTTKVNDLIVS
jgi:hypothetical protein